MADFVEAARLDQVLPGKGTTVTVSGKSVALFNVNGNIYAIDDSCRHQGSSLGTGKLDGKIVTCRGHGWRFDVTTGYVASSPGFGVDSYPVKVVDGKIMVAIGENKKTS
jgi:3-phenylpropionate/trans-cinnamate dioxygenase ferredoxin subunit